MCPCIKSGELLHHLKFGILIFSCENNPLHGSQLHTLQVDMMTTIKCDLWHGRACFAVHKPHHEWQGSVLVL